MKIIDWESQGSALEIIQAIGEGEAFAVSLNGSPAAAFVSTLGSTRVGITPESATLLVSMTVILAVSGLVLFALARGFKVSGKAKDSMGNEYELHFEPRA